MAINVQHSVTPSLVGTVAVGAGRGEFEQKQVKRQDEIDKWRSEMEQREFLQAQQIAARQQSDVFGHASAMQRAGFGAQVDAGQRAQEYAFRGQQQQDQQAHALEQQQQAAELQKQAYLDRLNADGQRQKQKLDEDYKNIMDAQIDEEDRQQYLQQWQAKKFGFDKALPSLVFKEGERPGDRLVSGDTEYIVGPDGKLQKGGQVQLTPEQLQEDFDRNTLVVPGEGRWVKGPRGWESPTPKPEPKPHTPPKPMFSPSDIAAERERQLRILETQEETNSEGKQVLRPVDPAELDRRTDEALARTQSYIERSQQPKSLAEAHRVIDSLPIVASDEEFNSLPPNTYYRDSRTPQAVSRKPDATSPPPPIAAAPPMAPQAAQPQAAPAQPAAPPQVSPQEAETIRQGVAKAEADARAIIARYRSPDEMPQEAKAAVNQLRIQRLYMLNLLGQR